MKTITILSVLAISTIVCAQEKKRGFTLDNFNSSIGFTTNQDPGLSINEVRMLAPNSNLLSEHESLINPSNARSGYANGLSELQLNIGFRNNNHPSQKLQFGITYQQKMYGYMNQGVDSKYTIDTLVSQQTNAQYMVDSISSRNLFAKMQSEVVRLMASYRFHKHAGEKLSLYGGIGLSGGLTFNSQTTVTYLEAYGRYVNGLSSTPQQGQSRYNDVGIERESFDNELSFSVGAFVPLGIDYTLGEWESGVNSLTVFFEAQPGIFAQRIPEINSMVSSFYSTQTLGVRIGL